jgi:hypothetical protein
MSTQQSLPWHSALTWIEILFPFLPKPPKKKNDYTEGGVSHLLDRFLGASHSRSGHWLPVVEKALVA